MNSMIASIIQLARRFATEGPVRLRKLSNYFYTKGANNPAFHEWLRGFDILKIQPPPGVDQNLHQIPSGSLILNRWSRRAPKYLRKSQ